MTRKQNPQHWLETFILSFLILVPMLLVMLGLLSSIPLRAGEVPALQALGEPAPAEAGKALRIAAARSRQPGLSPEPSAVRGSLGLSLDPHNTLHLFVVLPALAGLVILGGSLVVWAILGQKWPDGRPRGGMARTRCVFFGLVWWLALSTFLVLDLAGSASLHPGFVALYAFCWIPVGLLLLHPQPARVKVLVLGLFLAILFSTRLVDWNSRKPFLKDLDRVRVGMTEPYTDRIMARYRKEISPMANVDEVGEVRTGAVSYRHTAEGWGNADVGVLTFENRRVTDIKFYPD